jgi:RNA polymerase sigma factor (sigma-70 family)
MQEALATVERVGGNGRGAAADPAQMVLSHHMEQQVLEVIAGLPLKQKAALVQRKLHGLPYDSIATSLQCSQDAARAHVFQAIKKIRTALELAPNRQRQRHRPNGHRPTRETL